MRKRAAGVLATHYVGAGRVLDEDRVDLGPVARETPTDPEHDRQGTSAKAGCRNMNVHVRLLPLLSDRAKETGRVAADDLFLGVDHHLWRVLSVELPQECIPVARSLSLSIRTIRLCRYDDQSADEHGDEKQSRVYETRCHRVRSPQNNHGTPAVSE